ncbi:DoxX family protein [Oceaniglobus ichthyenteri]|uniref:DoxX family protein n=1 Tax=Oceaniglobus ichthyenteri TaxID=2136177 RepID=UPI000D346FC2|nr:DoxX family protein [Oceaniglobus ichthyenteri]
MLWVEDILESAVMWFLARVLATFFFWWAGLGFILDQDTARATMDALGFQPAWLFAILVPAVQIIGSLIVISDRFVWFGAGMLGVFTIGTIFMVHDFWNMSGPARQQNYLSAQEHITVIGGLIVVAIASHIRHLWIEQRRRHGFL